MDTCQIIFTTGFVSDGRLCVTSYTATCDEQPGICHRDAQCIYSHDEQRYTCICRPGTVGDGYTDCKLERNLFWLVNQFHTKWWSFLTESHRLCCVRSLTVLTVTVLPYSSCAKFLIEISRLISNILSQLKLALRIGCWRITPAYD